MAETVPLLLKLSDLGMARVLKASPYYLKASDDKVCVLFISVHCPFDLSFLLLCARRYP